MLCFCHLGRPRRHPTHNHMNIPSRLLLIVVTALVSLAETGTAQIAPAGLTVIQGPTGVYYVFYSDSVQPGRSEFYYLNYNTTEFDAITPNVSTDGSFSGVSSNTGRSLAGTVQASSISLTYNGATKSGAKESVYGPTRRFAGQWLGTVTDPTIGTGFGRFIVSSNGECFVYYAQDF